MKIFLLLVPLVTTFLGMIIYRLQDGKRELFRLDFVQFVYLFVITPTFFVWLKTFLFYVLRSEVGNQLSVTELFVVDTIFSVIAFFVLAAIAIHSLTKTFWIRRYHDPKFDLFHLSEYFHLWWTHIIIWGGGMVLCSFISIASVFLPADVNNNRIQFYLLLLTGFVLGNLFFFGIWGSDPKQGNFMRLMKLLLAGFFMLHVIFYFVMDVSFSLKNGVFWVIFSGFAGSVFASYFFERSEKTNKLRQFFLHLGWGNNMLVK